MKKRLFIAIEIPTAIKEKIVSLQNQIKDPNIEATWVRPENIHLTIVFFGRYRLYPNSGYHHGSRKVKN